MPDGGGINVLVVDDHLVVRHELRRLITEAGATVAGEASTAVAAVTEAQATQPDVVLLDLDLPDASGLDVMAEIARVAPGVRIIVLTASNAEADIRRALEQGAAGYLTKSLSGTAIIEAISGVGPGVTVLGEDAMRLLLSGASPRAAAARAAIERLSPRERDILALLADGLSAAEAAAGLGISVRTVEGHARAILNRLGARNRAEAVRIFVESGVQNT